VSAIEARRLVPSVAAALALARVLGCSVEELFATPAAAAASPPRFAWLPFAFPCRYWSAEMGGQTLLFPVENNLHGGLPHDGVAHGPDVSSLAFPLAAKTLVVAGCDPAAGLLAGIFGQQGGLRMLALTRSSSESLALLEAGLVHVAGVHLAPGDDRGGNGAALSARGPRLDLQLLHVARWEEGLAYSPGVRLRSVAAAARSALRWVGRTPGAGARRCQDLVRGRRPAPQYSARDHRAVVEAIKNGWADIGVCVRLASDDGQLAFLPVCEEPYDLCFRRPDSADPRIVALVRAVRSDEYRRLLGELPGYRPQQLGELEHVRAK
jgi:molybdate-binding protein